MTNHVLPPIGGGGGGARVPVLVSGSPFADVAALETWSQANPTELLNNTDNFATAVVDGINYSWEGEDGVYSADSWIRQNSLSSEQEAAVDSIVNLTDGAIPYASSGQLTESLGTQNDMTTVNFDGEVRTSKSTLFIGDSLSLSEDGATVRLNDPIDNIQALAAGTQLNPDGTTGINYVLSRDNPQDLVLQPSDTNTLIGDWTAHLPVTGNRIIKQIRTRFAQDATGIRFVLREAANSSDTTGPILYQSHTLTEWEAGEGLSVTSSPQGGPGTFALDLDDSAKVVLGELVYVTLEQNTQGTGDLELRGDTLNIGGITQFYAYLEQTFVIESQSELALKEDLTDPLGYATITNLERINNNWESFGKVQLDNTLSEVSEIQVAVIKSQSNASDHDFRIVYGGTNAAHAGEIYFTGNLTDTTAGTYIVDLAATATAVPSESDVVLESQAMQVSGSRVDHQSTMIKYQERS